MALSLNGVDSSCMNSITGSTCRAKYSNILHDSQIDQSLFLIARVAKCQSAKCFSAKRRVASYLPGNLDVVRSEWDFDGFGLLVHLHVGHVDVSLGSML
jgi:hypothetical protein